MSENMVERVEAAIMRALASDSLQHVERERHGGETVIDGHFDLSAVARAAIEAMDPPTKWMRDEGMRAHMAALYVGKEPINTGIEAGLKAVDLVWPAMLTAALKP